MGSEYPTQPDVLPILADEFDRPKAAWFNRLFDALFKVQTELGADPTALGGAWSAHADMTSILAAFGVMEWGQFTVNLPQDSPVEVNFMNAGRFTEAANIIVLVRRVFTDKGRRIGENLDIAVDVEPATGTPTGFKFYRRNLTSASEREETYQYLAWEDTL